MKILIVDNNLHIGGYPQGLIVKTHLGVKGTINSYIRRVSELQTSDYNVDRVILTGSASYVREEKPWMIQERKCIHQWMKRKIPILGICFGGQLLARHIFGKDAVQALPVPMSGSLLIKFKKNCNLFRELPNPLGVVSTHYEGFIVSKQYRVAEIEEWPSYAFQYPPHVYGIQFHPELMGFVGRTIVKIQRSIYDRHVYQDFSVTTHSRYGRRIFKNFINI